MFEKTLGVIKEQKRREREEKKRRERETNNLKKESLFTAKLSDKLKIMNLLLNNLNVKSVTFRVKPEDDAIVYKFMQGEELANYNVDKNGYDYTINYKTVDI